MKKFFCAIIISAILFSAVSFADILDGVFVPSYSGFMDSFYEYLSETSQFASDRILVYRHENSWDEDIAASSIDAFVQLNEAESVSICIHSSGFNDLLFASLRMKRSATDEDAALFVEIGELIVKAADPYFFDDNPERSPAMILKRLQNCADDRLDTSENEGWSASMSPHRYVSIRQGDYVYFYVELVHDDISNRVIFTPTEGRTSNPLYDMHFD